MSGVLSILFIKHPLTHQKESYSAIATELESQSEQCCDYNLIMRCILWCMKCIDKMNENKVLVNSVVIFQGNIIIPENGKLVLPR